MGSIAKYFSPQFELKHGHRKRDPFQSLSRINQSSGGLCVPGEDVRTHPRKKKEMFALKVTRAL